MHPIIESHVSELVSLDNLRSEVGVEDILKQTHLVVIRMLEMSN